jgi:amino acid permease
MIQRYFNVLRRHFVVLILIIALVIISSVTKGKISVVTSYAAGALMIYAAISFIVYIIKTPAKKSKEEVA